MLSCDFVRSSSRRLAVCLALVVGTMACVAAPWWTADRVRTEDTNGDRRPDVWRTYNNRGQLTATRIDTNFDGRPDVEEYYEQGNLVRRELDRDFDDRVDLVEEFDPTTHEETRSIVDVDRDGTADLLVLFRGAGWPASTQWTHGTPTDLTAAQTAMRALPVVRRNGDALTPMIDPFRANAALSYGRPVVGSNGCVVLSSAAGLPRPFGGITRVAPSGRVNHRDVWISSLTAQRTRAPRGPPIGLS
jgi:hypothetical protein